MTINIAKILNSKNAIFHNEGLQVYAYLEEAIKQSKPIELSLEGVKHCSTQFLNACIGKLYINFPATTIKQFLVITGKEENSMFQLSLKTVIDNAINSDTYNKMYDEAVAEF